MSTNNRTSNTIIAVTTVIASSSALGDVKIADRSAMMVQRTPQATLEVQTDGTATDNALLVRGPNPSAIQLLLVRDDGKVAVGDGVPAYTLDVYGAARVSDTPIITSGHSMLVKDSSSGQISEQVVPDGKVPEWIDDGSVNFDALTATRAAGTAPTFDPDAHSNIRRYRELGNDWVEEQIEVNSNGAGGIGGSGYYVYQPKFPIDTTYHLTYTGNLNSDLRAAGRSYGINIGQGVVSATAVSSTVGVYATMYAIPISGTEIAFATVPGNTGNVAFINDFYFTLAALEWSAKIRIKYKKDV
ncbi:hypothetical protein OAS86_04180 [Gammaproteobacteria bacterium]|nr:hypothetical protein [Gammaproteobacteria bacterium]